MARKMSPRAAKRATKPNPRADRNPEFFEGVENTLRQYPNKKNRNAFQNTPKRKIPVLHPRNIAQEKYIEILEDDNKYISCVYGAAGTGKSHLALTAGIKALLEKRVSKLILCRPAITVDNEQHGFLPGDLISKMKIWNRNALDLLSVYFSKPEIEKMLFDETIEMAPLSHMRGRNLGGEATGPVYVYLEEAQNASHSQILMLLTRLCNDPDDEFPSRIFLTGDTKQHDRGSLKSGLLDFVERVEARGDHPNIGICSFTPKDAVRHPMIADILKMYGQE